MDALPRRLGRIDHIGRALAYVLIALFGAHAALDETRYSRDAT